jgi:hypothetical protein
MGHDSYDEEGLTAIDYSGNESIFIALNVEDSVTAHQIS